MRLNIKLIAPVAALVAGALLWAPTAPAGATGDTLSRPCGGAEATCETEAEVGDTCYLYVRGEGKVRGTVTSTSPLTCTCPVPEPEPCEAGTVRDDEGDCVAECETVPGVPASSEECEEPEATTTTTTTVTPGPPEVTQAPPAPELGGPEQPGGSEAVVGAPAPAVATQAAFTG